MRLNLEAERGRRQLTKEALADAVGISTRTYNNYVQGNTPIPSDVLLRFSSLFRCSADYLLEELDAG
jgi:transcriptional regulator with XRE-family HTH domain